MISKSLIYQKNLTNFFNFSKEEKRNKSIELLNKSKKLILDTDKYLNYSSYYKKLTMKYSFKLPGITNYPILKNETIIPIKKYKIKNSSLTQRLILSDYNRDQKYKKKIKEFNSNNIINENLNNINSNSFLTYIDKFNNMDNVIHKYITYKENYFVNKNKDGNKKLLEQYINKLIDNDEIHQNFLENSIYKKENIFFIKKTEIKLRCDSIILYFYNEKKKISKIKFPFESIPFFYGIDFESFKLFIFSVIDYDYKNNIFKLNEEKYNKNFMNYLNEKTFYKEDCFLLNFSKSPHFKYDWIVQSECIKKYKMKIQMPKIKIRFKYSNNVKTTLIKSLDSIHMSYLVLEKFKDWDLFLLNSFCLIKEFRIKINQALSYNPVLNKNNIKIDLDPPIIKFNNKNYSKYTFDFFISFKEEIFGRNLFFKINTPKIQINYTTDNIKIPYEKIYKLNIKESIQLNKMRNSFWPEDMINRCLDIKEKVKENLIESKLELDKKIFDFDNDLLRFIKRQDTFLNEIIRNKSILKITILFPSIIYYSSIKLIKNKYNLTREEFEELFELSVFDWHKYIIKNISKIERIKKKERIINFRDNEKKNTVMMGSLRNLKKHRQKTMKALSKFKVNLDD